MVAVHEGALLAPASAHTQLIGLRYGDVIWAGALGEHLLTVEAEASGDPRQLLGDAVGAGPRLWDVVWPLELVADSRRGPPSTIYQGERPWVVIGVVTGGDLLAAPLNEAANQWTDEDEGQGSIMMVVATDAPLDPLKLERLAKRAVMGLARTGSFAGNGSGDYVIAFSTAEGVRRQPGEEWTESVEVTNDRISGLFEAAAEATQEAIYNSLLKATTVSGMGRTADAIDVDEVVRVLREYNVIRP